jgi:hypothetical protein
VECALAGSAITAVYALIETVTISAVMRITITRFIFAVIFPVAVIFRTSFGSWGGLLLGPLFTLRFQL